MPQRRKGRRLTRRKAKGPPALLPRDSDSRNRPSTSPSPTERRRWPHGRRRGAAPDAADREPSDGRNGHLVGEATRRRDHRHRGAAVRRRQCGSAPAPCRWQYCARAQALREIDAPRDRDGGRHCTASSSAPAHAVILDRRPPRGAAVRRQRFDRQLVGTGARGREVVLDRRPPRGAAVRHRRVDRQFIGTGARGRPRQARRSAVGAPTGISSAPPRAAVRGRRPLRGAAAPARRPATASTHAAVRSGLPSCSAAAPLPRPQPSEHVPVADRTAPMASRLLSRRGARRHGPRTR